MLEAAGLLMGLTVFFNASFHALFTLPVAIMSIAAPLNAWTPAETDLSQSVLLSEPASVLDAPVTLTLVTFNIQDLIVVGRDRPERMRAIGEVLTELDPDIVGIQEAFVEADRHILFDSLRGSRLHHRHYFRSGLMGSGLLTLSAYPIVEAFFHRYEHAGKWYKPYHGDWWGGKGVSLCRIALPDGAGIIDFYNTHAQAGYGDPAEYLAVRRGQMTELAAFVRASSAATSPAFLVGDMNCRPGAPAFDIAVEHGRLERLMTIKTGIDHIFGIRKPRYALDVIDTTPIQKLITVADGRQSGLSDHSGYCSTIHITPTPEA